MSLPYQRTASWLRGLPVLSLCMLYMQIILFLLQCFSMSTIAVTGETEMCSGQAFLAVLCQPQVSGLLH